MIYFMEHNDYIYDTFTAKVAKSRNMDIEAVDQIGQGRVWSKIHEQKLLWLTRVLNIIERP
jgi:ClpP class serine protease